TVVAAATRPDLVETGITEPPAAARPGTTFSVTDTVKNQGGQSAGASTTRYYLSLDGAPGGGDTRLTAVHAVTALAPGAVSKKTVIVTIPAAMPTGTFRLLACADDTKLVIESDETNNCLASAGAITIALPDLVQQVVSNAGGPVQRGRTFAVSD